MKNKEQVKTPNGYKTIIMAVVTFALLDFCIIVFLTGVVSPFISCYAVDSSERLYVRNGEFIDVYYNCSFVDRINAPTSRDYRFTIEDDSILLATPTSQHLMTLEGRILETVEDLGGNAFIGMDSPTKNFKSVNDNDYSLKGRFWVSRIVKNGQETVYQIDNFSFFIKIAMYVTVPFSIIVFVNLISFCIKKKYGDD